MYVKVTQNQLIRSTDLFLEETCSQRRRRTTFTVQQQIVLQRQFAADQYLTLSVRKRLAASLDLTERAVKVRIHSLITR